MRKPSQSRSCSWKYFSHWFVLIIQKLLLSTDKSCLAEMVVCNHNERSQLLKINYKHQKQGIMNGIEKVTRWSNWHSKKHLPLNGKCIKVVVKYTGTMDIEITNTIWKNVYAACDSVPSTYCFAKHLCLLLKTALSYIVHTSFAFISFLESDNATAKLRRTFPEFLFFTFMLWFCDMLWLRIFFISYYVHAVNKGDSVSTYRLTNYRESAWAFVARTTSSDATGIVQILVGWCPWYTFHSPPKRI